MALISYALRVDETPYLGVIADDSGAELVYSSGDTEVVDSPPPGVEPFSGEQAWLDAIIGVYPGESFSQPVQVANRNKARAQVIKTLVEHVPDESSWTSTAAGRALDTTSQSYPVVVPYSEQDEEDEDPQAMTHLVLDMLGPIDPEGQYGWILREMDGEAREEDAESFLSFGAPPSDSEEEEEEENSRED